MLRVLLAKAVIDRPAGIPTVMVFSKADGEALHVCSGDAAYCIGPAAASKSYLNQEAIFKVSSLPSLSPNELWRGSEAWTSLSEREAALCLALAAWQGLFHSFSVLYRGAAVSGVTMQQNSQQLRKCWVLPTQNSPISVPLLVSYGAKLKEYNKEVSLAGISIDEHQHTRTSVFTCAAYTEIETCTDFSNLSQCMLEGQNSPAALQGASEISGAHQGQPRCIPKRQVSRSAQNQPEVQVKMTGGERSSDLTESVRDHGSRVSGCMHAGG